MNVNGLHQDFTEVVARLILHKDMIAKGASNPNTDHWQDLYTGRGLVPGCERLKYSDIIPYNRFRAEVDGTVALLLNHTQKRVEEAPEWR